MKRKIYLAALILATLVITIESCGPKKKVHRSGGRNSSGRMY